LFTQIVHSHPEPSKHDVVWHAQIYSILPLHQLKESHKKLKLLFHRLKTVVFYFSRAVV